MQLRLLFLIGWCLCWATASAKATHTPPTDSSLVVSACISDSLLLEEVIITGNKKTKESVLRAELDLPFNQLTDSATFFRKVNENRLRIYNLQLFHSVQAIISCNGRAVTVTFKVQERWYLFPVPIFTLADRNLNAWLDKMDFSRIDYGLHLMQYNFRGRNETIRMNLQHGYNRKYELFYAIPYINRKHKLGLSLGGSFYQSHALDYLTFNDTLATFRDDNSFPIRRSYISATLIRRANVQRQWSVGVSYHRQQITDTVAALNPAYFRYGTQRQFWQLELARTLNFRNTFAYPLSGRYLQLSLINQFLSGGNYNLAFKTKFAHYLPLPRNFYYSYGVEGQARLSESLAYVDNQALGYKSWVRGYQLYVVDGQHYGMLKQGLSKKIIDIPEIYLGFMPSDKFRRIPFAAFLNIFVDGAFVIDQEYEQFNRLSNRLLVGYGLGLHLVTYYDRVVTIEYTFNRERERGFFIHTQFPI